MKRNTLITVLLALSAMQAWAQPQYSDLDTVTGKKRGLYTREWYTDCSQYRDSSGRLAEMGYLNNTGRLLMAVEHVVEGRMEVRGLAAMVAIDVDFDTTYISGMLPLDRLPETLYLVQGMDAVPGTGLLFPRVMRVVDSLRWDTVTPSVMRLPRRPDAVADTDYMECYLYEAYFDNPRMVDSVFYVIGTARSSVMKAVQLPEGSSPISVMRYTHYPTEYQYVTDTEEDACSNCWSGLRSRIFGTSLGIDATPEMWNPFNFYVDRFNLYPGMLFPIADMHNLRLNASNPEAGSVEGGGDYPHLSTARATAVPAPGYTFLHWSDGVTDNPRTIEMTSDVNLVAVFQ